MINEHKLDKAIRFFLYVLIFWIPYSPAVVETCVIISLLLWIVKRWFFVKVENRAGGWISRFKPPLSPINKPIVFFLLVCIISVSGSIFWQQSWHNFLTKTLEWFIVYFLVIEVFRTRQHIVIALGIFLFTAASTALDGIVQYHITYKDLFLGRVIEPGGRATAGFKAPTGLGAYLCLVIPVSLSTLFLNKRPRIQKVSFFLVFLLAVWAMVVTYSRGAWTSAMIGVLLLPLIICFYNRQKLISIIFALCIICIILFGYFGWILTSSLDMEFFMRNRTVLWRLDIWQESLPMIKDKLFFGHGINTYMSLFETYRKDVSASPTYAHNCYVQLAVETGLAGLISFIWIISALFFKTAREIKNIATQNREMMVLSAGLLSGIFAFLLHSTFDTNFYSLQLSVYLWTMIGILVAIFNTARLEGESS